MSRWTHNMCISCWRSLRPLREFPVQRLQLSTDLCCYCGAENNDGVYVRQDPTEVACEGRFMMHTEAP